MAFGYFDRIKETSTSTGTGNIALAGAVSGFRSFSSVFANADTFYYTIASQTNGEWEVGLGTWNTGNTISRSVIASSNANALVNFSSGGLNVWVDLPAAALPTSSGVTGSGQMVLATSPTLSGTVVVDNLQTSGSSGVAIKNSGGTTVATIGPANTTNVTFAGAVNINGSEAVASASNTLTFSNKTISGSSNTISNIGNSSLTNSAVTIGSTSVSLGATATSLAGLTSVAATTFTGALTGNASTATALATGRTIGGVTFDGTANIVPQTIQSVNEAADTTCFPLFISASGSQSLQPLNNASLTFNASSAQLGAASVSVTGSAVAGNSMYLPAANTLGWSINGTGEVRLTSTALSPETSDGNALGTSSLQWSDLYLASGALIDFANGNSVITHSSGILTVSTGDLRVTTAGTNSASAVTVGGTQTLTGKTLSDSLISVTTPAVRSTGYLGAPQNLALDSGNHTLTLANSGEAMDKTTASARTLTIPANGTTAFQIGTVICGTNEGSGALTIQITTDTLKYEALTGTRTVAQNGGWWLRKIAATEWRLYGTNIT